MTDEPTAEPTVRHDPTTHRFELAVDGRVAELDYHRSGDRLVITHTGVPAALEGQGIGSLLVEAAVAEAERQGLAVDARCWFAARWLGRHPERARAVRAA